MSRFANRMLYGSAVAAVVAACCATVALATPRPPARPTKAAHAGPPRAGTKPGAAGAPQASGQDKPVPPSGASDFTLKGGQEGTVFHNLTVEGEDRIHVDFDRPAITLDLDPSQAPGLEGGSARDELERTTPDLAAPLATLSARQECAYLGRPWLNEFASGPVARFRPAVDGVERWKLVVVDAGGQSVATFSGRGKPPREIDWDGRSQTGAPVSPGLTYSYVFEAYDRAGNKRNFVGQGFSVLAYRLQAPEGSTLLFTARGLDSDAPGSAAPRTATPPILLEAASWLNQSERLTTPIQVTATARSYEQANHLVQLVTTALGPIVLGDPARIHSNAIVQTDAPEEGTLAIGPGR